MQRIARCDMSGLESSKDKRSGNTKVSLLEELKSYRQRVRELEQILTGQDLQAIADEQESCRLVQALQPARMTVWYWTAATGQTQTLPSRGDVPDNRGGRASEVTPFEKKLPEAIHPDDRDALAFVCDRAYRKCLPYDAEYRLVQADGEVRHNREIGNPDFGETGQYLGHFGTTQDITEQKLAKEALRKALDEFEVRDTEHVVKLREREVQLKKPPGSLTSDIGVSTR